MSLLKSLFGGTFESNREQGETLFAQGCFGESKLAFDRALARSKGARDDEIEAVKQRVRSCKLALARAKIENADREAQEGNIRQAIEMLEEAGEICGEQEILEAISARKTKYESEDARRLADDGEEISDDELLAIIAGTWIEPQAQEYAAMPESFREALLASHDGEFARAAELMSEVLAESGLPVPPVFVWLELGRVRLQAGNAAGAIEALGSFLNLVSDDEETVETRVSAHALKADAFTRLKRIDEAKEELIATTRLTPQDHTTFLALGVFLRAAGDYERSLRALERARELMGQMNPDFKVIRELGFTYLAMGQKEEALKLLNAVLEHSAAQGNHDQFDPETAVAAARIYEEKGELMHAADLFRHLALGYDVTNHFTYNLEAARLLKLAGGQTSLVERYLTRAAELARNDEQKALVGRIRLSTGS